MPMQWMGQYHALIARSPRRLSGGCAAVLRQAYPTDRSASIRRLSGAAVEHKVGAEMLALFIRFWLTHTPPLPDTALPAAQARGSERFDGFVEALGRRLARGNTFADDLTREVEAAKRAQPGTDSDDP
jgi:hypothetical protein